MRSLLSRKFLLAAGAIAVMSYFKLSDGALAAISSLAIAYLTANVAQKKQAAE